MAMAFVHGGAAVRILFPSLFKYLSGMRPYDIIVAIDEVPVESLRNILQKVYYSTGST
jgi:membrane-associated protease RseP (regulator of RpoE activity)